LDKKFHWIVTNALINAPFGETKIKDKTLAQLQEPGSNDYLVNGRLLGWQAKWPPGWAKNVTEKGLCWPWYNNVPPLHYSRPRRTTPLSLLNRVKELLNQKVVERSKGKVFLNRLFEAPKRNSQESRLVLDISKLNQHIQTFKFKKLSVAQVRLTLQPGTLLASLDLKEAYWHIPIHRRYRPYLAFSAGNQIYQFKVLPFGLNIAPRVFSKMLQPVQARLVKMGVQIFMYLDDWLILTVTPRECRSMIQKTLEIGTSMGLQFNIQKSHLSPTPSIKWLGLIWDKSTATLRLSIDNCRRCCKKIFKAIWLTKPRLSSDSTWQTSITPREPNNIHFSRKRSPHPLSTSTTLSVKMVDKERTLRYSGSMGSTSTSYDTYYRCIRHRMGIPVVHRPSRLRSMDPICKPNSYKCSRVTNSSFSTTERTLNQTNIGLSAVR